MGSISFTSSSMASTFHHHHSDPFPLRRAPRLPSGRYPTVRPVARAAKGEEDSWPEYTGTVDENMIVLRKRMRDVEAAERSYEPPSHWSDWEKSWHCTSYGSDVCGFAGTVQTLLMNARPGVGVGLLALLAMTVPTSAVLIFMHLLDAAARISPPPIFG